MAKKKRHMDGEAPSNIDIILVLVEKGRKMVKASSNNKLSYIVELAKTILKDDPVDFTDHTGKKMRLDRNEPIIICAGKKLDLNKTLEENEVFHESTLHIYYQFYPVVEDGSCVVM